MRFRSCLAAAIVAAAPAFAQIQTASKPGVIAPNATTVQGCHGAATGCVPVDISGTISTAGTADVVSGGAPTTFSANAACTGQLLLAGEQGAGFQLNPSGTLIGTLTPQYSMDTAGSNWTTTQFIDQNGSKTAFISATNPTSLTQLGIVLVTGARRAQVCTTAYTSGSATGFAVAAYVQGGVAASGGGGSSDVAIHDNGTPSQHLGVNASGQAAIQNPPNLDAALSTRATETTAQAIRDRLPAALDASGGVKVHEVGTAAISAASLPLPTGAATETTLAGVKTGTDRIPSSPATDRTTAAGPFSVRVSDGAAFIDPRDVSDRSARQLGHVVSDSGSVTSATMHGATKGATSAADATVTAEGADHNAIDVTLWLSGSALDPRTRTWSLGASDVPDLSDRAARLLGIIYGSQGAQLKQSAVNFNTVVELAVGSGLIDPRQVRALTSSDTVTVVQATGTNLHFVCDSGCGGAASFADLAAFASGSTSINIAGGEFDDTPLADVATGKAAAVRITKQRAEHVNLRNASGTEIGTASNPVATQTQSGSVTSATIAVDSVGLAKDSKFTDDVAGSSNADEAATTRLAVNSALRLYNSGGTANARLQPWPGDSANGGKVQVTTLPSIPTGSNVIGHVVTDSGSVANVTITTDSVGLAKDATLTGGSAKTIVRGGQKGTTNTNADITHTASGANHELVDVGIYDGSGNLKDPTQIRALTSSDVVDVSDRTGRSLGHVVTDSGSTTAVSSTVTPAGLTSLTTGQLAVTASVQQLPTNSAKLVCLKVLDGGTQNVKFGPTGVATTTGQELVPGEGACRPADNTNRIFVIAGGTGSTVAWEAWN
jgi:hypothetical protein